MKNITIVLSDDDTKQIETLQKRYLLPSIGSLLRFLVNKEHDVNILQQQINELREAVISLQKKGEHTYRMHK